MLKIKRIFLVLLLLLSLSFVYACSEKEPSIKKEYYLKADIESMEINVDEQYEIKIDTDIPNPLTWESNEPEIADVDENGLVTGISKGFTIITCSYQKYILEISVTVRPRILPPKTHNLTIYGYETIEVRDGVSLSYILLSNFGNLQHKNFDDLIFNGWYRDNNYKNELDLSQKIYNDLTIYPKYSKDNTICEQKIAVNNTLFYEDVILKDSSVQVFTADYGKTIAYEEETYNDSLIAITNYNYSTKNTTIIEVLKDGNKANTIIPYNGYVIMIPKSNELYAQYEEKLQVGKVVSLDTYSINTANKIYINKEINIDNPDELNISLDANYISVYDYTNNKYLYQKNSASTAYPASTTKIICALAALENASVDTIITVGDEFDVTYEGDSPSTAGLQKGQMWTLRQLLYALMLPSGNDAAYVIAAGVARSIKGNENLNIREQLEYFNNLMNNVAKKIGAHNSHFMVPDGNSYYNSDGSWSNRLSQHYVTADDMIKFAMLALNYSMLAKVVSTYTINFSIVSEKAYTFYNTNLLIKPIRSEVYLKNAIGIKTGTTNPGGYCLICAYEVDGRIVIASILKGTTSMNRYYDAVKIYNAVYN